MNLSKLGISSWIIFLNIFLIITLYIVILTNKYESFANIPQQVNPTATISSNPEITTANNAYASILMFLQNNPSKSAKFIEDIKNKFFSNNCTVKSDINFTDIAKMPYGMPFS
jgi:hypothetical protein